MGRLVSEQESSPLERSKFSLEEIKEADEAKVAYEGWVEIEDVAFTDKGTSISWKEESDKGDYELEYTALVDEIKRLR